MGLYNDAKIKDFIKYVNLKYFLPDIQREFVWRPDQIYFLYDSIMRGYPINTFLLWKTSRDFLKTSKIKKFKFVTNNESKNEEDLSASESEYYLVLDGQQRITSFMIALSGYYKERGKRKELYFNLYSGEREDDDGLLYEFKFIDTDRYEWKPDETRDYFVEIRSDNGTPEYALWLKVKVLYEIQSMKEREDLKRNVEKVGKDYGSPSPEKLNLAKVKLETLWHNLTVLSILSYYVTEETEYDKVLDIFVRTNAGGTKLTNSDLLFSIIKLHWGDARDNFTDLLNILNIGGFEFDSDFLLKTWLVVNATTQDEVRYRRSNFDSEDKISDLKSHWDKISQSFRITKDILASFGINHGKLLSSNNAVIPIMYYVYKNEIKGLGDSHQRNTLCKADLENIKHFLISSLLTGLFSGSSDTLLYAVKDVIDKSSAPQFPLGEINTEMKKRNRPMNVTEELLDNIEYNDTRSFLVLALLYNNVNFNPSFRGNVPEQDHIFSKDELTEAGAPPNRINKIYNLRYVTSTANRRKGGTKFKEWIQTLSEQEKHEHLIPQGEWDVENFQDFLNRRRELILEEINKRLPN